MIVNRFTIIVDACVLHSVLKRNIIMSLAQEGLFRPRWSQKILDEFENSLKARFDKTMAKQQREILENVFPEALVAVDAHIETALTLPDKNDRHVLAAAIKVRAGLIVTDNLKDFPQGVLASHETEAINADNFIADSISISPREALFALDNMLNRFNNPQVDMDGLILWMEKEGMTEASKFLIRVLPE